MEYKLVIIEDANDTTAIIHLDAMRSPSECEAIVNRKKGG